MSPTINKERAKKEQWKNKDNEHYAAFMIYRIMSKKPFGILTNAVSKLVYVMKKAGSLKEFKQFNKL